MTGCSPISTIKSKTIYDLHVCFRNNDNHNEPRELSHLQRAMQIVLATEAVTLHWPGQWRSVDSHRTSHCFARIAPKKLLFSDDKQVYQCQVDGFFKGLNLPLRGSVINRFFSSDMNEV